MLLQTDALKLDKVLLAFFFWLSAFCINKTIGKDACCYFIGIMSGVRAEHAV